MISSNTLISDLINAGNDAATNLFLVSIFTDNEDSSPLRFRATDVTIPSIGNTTVSLPYQNTEYLCIAPGMAFTRRLSIIYRVDDNYDVLKKLYSLLSVSTSGGDGFKQTDDKKTMSITVTAMKNLEKDALVYSFTGCRLEAINDITYSYDNASQLKTGNLRIIFSDMQITGSTDS